MPASSVTFIGEMRDLVARLVSHGVAQPAIKGALHALWGQVEGATTAWRDVDPLIRDEVRQLIDRGHTIDEIVAHLQALGVRVSRSAVGRAAKSYKDEIKAYKDTQTIASVWVKEFQADPQSDIGRLLTELLKVVSFNTLREAQMDGTSEQGLYFLSKALKELTAADAKRAEMEVAIRSQVAAEVTAAVETARERVTAEPGLTAAQIDLINRELLGVPAAVRRDGDD